MNLNISCNISIFVRYRFQPCSWSGDDDHRSSIVSCKTIESRSTVCISVSSVSNTWSRNLSTSAPVLTFTPADVNDSYICIISHIWLSLNVQSSKKKSHSFINFNGLEVICSRELIKSRFFSLGIFLWRVWLGLTSCCCCCSWLILAT